MKILINIFLLLLYINLILTEVSYVDGDYWFPFPTISMDYNNESAIDMSYLNWKIEDRIKIQNGHFYYKDKQVKFFGTNVAYAAAFPSKEYAPKIAKRMAQLGINIVRFHHMDNRDIWGINYSQSQENNLKSEISEEQLDKLHYFLFCLKENGIYANINLHVSRNYPEILNNKNVTDAFNYGKSLDRYYPTFINDQLKYAKDLLDSFNKYTGFKVGEDPMILNIELNNENTMFNLENEDKVSKLTDNLKTELVNQWRTFIKKKYKSFDEINKFYNNETIDKNNNLVEKNKISTQNESSNYKIEDNNHVIFDITGKPSADWKNQIHYGLINITNYTLYTVEFDAKVKNPTEDKIVFQFQENLSPYRNYYKISNIKLTTEFKHYTLSQRTEYNCQFTENSKALVKIVLPPSINTFEFKNLKLYKGKGAMDFTEKGEKKLEKILFPNNTLIQNLPNMAYDLRLFFKYTETETQTTITNYIKNTLSFKDLLVLDSQISYGSFFTYEREHDNSDIIDIHGYWEHPQFETGHSWDMAYYSIKNTPMIKSPTFGTFNSISKGKCFNKPFTVSEYNHPFPSEHLHEKFAMFGSWSAYHDYDAIYQFSYDQPPEKDENYISGYFKMSSNPIDFALAPYIALAFRKNYVEKSKNNVLIKLTKGYIAEKMKDKNYNMNQFLENLFYAGWSAIYEVQILDDENIVEPKIIANIDTDEKDYFINEQIQWKNINEGNEAYYNVGNSKYITKTGFLGNLKMDIENHLGDLIDIKIKLNDTQNETCTIGLVSLDDRNLDNSEKLLLTIVGKVRNTNQKWNKDKTSTYKDGWGVAPTLVQFIEIEATLKFKEEEMPKVYSIDKYGKLNKEFKLSKKGNNWILKSDKENPTLNYYITRKIPAIKEYNEDYNNTTMIIIIAIVILFVIIVSIGVLLFIKRKRSKSTVSDIESGFLKNIN